MIAAFVLTLLAGLGLLMAVVKLARNKPGYSHARHTISELGEEGAPDQALTSLAVFLPISVAMGIVAYILTSSLPAAAILAFGLGTGYFAAAILPCDPGSPLTGSFNQGMHNLGGGIQYAAGAWALLRLGETHGLPFRVAGLIVAAALIGLSFPHPWRGGIQRIAEACLFGGLACAIWLAMK